MSNFSLYRKSLIALFIAMAAGFTACDTETPEERAEKDREKIIKYLKDNDMYDDAEEHSSGIFYVIEQEGSGGYPNINSTVKVSYTGYLLDGEMFDTRFESNLRLQNQIQGMRIGLTLFSRGSQGWILVPSDMGYGEYGRVGIPQNAVLVFEVEMIDFV